MLKLFRDWFVVAALLSWALYQQWEISHLVKQLHRHEEYLDHQLGLQLRVVGLVEGIHLREYRFVSWLQAIRQPGCAHVDTRDNMK